MRRTALLATLTALLLLGIGTSLRGEDKGLEARVATLEQEVATLKARLDKLEGARKPARRGDRVATIEDINNLRNLAALVVVSDKPPMKDGVLDPYAFVTKGDIVREQYKIFRSNRMGKGPTDEEIARGDYTNFPWERYRGEPRKLLGARIPLLWEKEPGADGQHVVCMSDGSSQLMSPEDLAAALGR
jgi:hypothetical protein